MPVMVDDAPLRTDELGLRTVGQVLAHLQRANRLVVHVLIDGLEPDLDRLPEFRKSPLQDHTVFIETTDPREMAMGILREVESQLRDAGQIRNETVDFLQKNQNVRAMEKLSGCFTVWQHAQQSLLGTAQLLKLDLSQVIVDGQPLCELLNEFTTQLREIKSALENRDFVTLGDLLVYETTQTDDRWRAALAELRRIISAS
jgi:hypothetical protein